MSRVRMAVSKLRGAMDRNPMVHWMDPLARRLGVVELAHKVCNLLDRDALAARAQDFCAFYEKHESDFHKLAEILQDDDSRYTLEKVLAYRKSYDMSVLKDVNVQPQYFQKDIFSPVKDEVFVDGGAYVGDTIKSYLKNWGGYKRIYAWEPDINNLKVLKRYVQDMDHIVLVPFGMWSEEKELCFRSDGTSCSKIMDETDADMIRIKVNSIDHVCAEDKVTFIKMDIEGSELEALKGAVTVIKRDKPRLAICVYHRPEDLYEIPFWIKETVPEYKLYLLHHSDGLSETVLYAIL